MIDWRLVEVGINNAFMNMAIDEAILRARIENLTQNTIRFYRWKPSAVSLGKFQKIEKEVHQDNCRKYGVDIVRRITGGGTVYHDSEDEITYSVVVGKEDLGNADIAAIYAEIYAGLVEALRLLGIAADYNPGNAKANPNLTVKGKKISGSAQSHKGGVVLQHGTILVAVDLEKMFKFLRVPWAKTYMKIVKVARSKITSVAKELNTTVSLAEVNQALIKGYRKAFNSDLVREELTIYERKLAKQLCEEKYTTADWNFNGKVY